jgi:hypothetical protein
VMMDLPTWEAVPRIIRAFLRRGGFTSVIRV